MASSPPPPPGQPPALPSRTSPQVAAHPKDHSRFNLIATTAAEEDAYDLLGERHLEKPSGVIWSCAMMVKGALGGGILSAHVAYKEAGLWFSIPCTVLLGTYMTYCLYILGISAQVLYRRCHVPYMTYPDVGEAAVALHPSPSVRKFAKIFRYFIDLIIILDLFGSCTCYQLMVSSTVKQIVEDVQETRVSGLPGYPNLRIYMVAMMVPFILICLIRHLQWLAPLSMGGNLLVVVAIGVTIYYSMKINPSFENHVAFTDFKGVFSFLGTIVYSMSCCGVVLPIENNMREPHKYAQALFLGMFLTVLAVSITAFFGYNAYLEDSKAPITLNFPMELLPKILKGCIALMIYVTHGINYWVPFNLTFHYLKKLHPPERHVFWEYIYRAVFVVIITITGIIFPDVSKVMSFLGCFCINNMAFTCPIVIYLFTAWERPGLGLYKWRLIWSIILLIFGIILFIAGSVASFADLMSVFGKSSEMIDSIIYEEDHKYIPKRHTSNSSIPATRRRYLKKL